MQVNALGALSTYAYQGALSQTGNADQALGQALAASQSVAADKSAQAPAKVGPVDPMDALRGDKSPQLPSFSTSPESSSSLGAQALAGALLGSSSSALLSASDSLPASAASQSPANHEALVRYAYDQSQNPSALSSAQPAPMGSGLNLLA